MLRRRKFLHFQHKPLDRPPVPSLKSLEEQVHLLDTFANGFHLRADGSVGPSGWVVAVQLPKAGTLWIRILRKYIFCNFRERLKINGQEMLPHSPVSEGEIKTGPRGF